MVFSENDKEKWTSIPLTKPTYAELARLRKLNGSKLETFDSLVSRLMKPYALKAAKDRME